MLAAFAAASLACSGDGPSSPAESASLHLVGDAGAITEANLITIRVRGTTPDSITAVRVGGVEAIAGYSDSTLLIVMPLGAPGAVNVAATVWSGLKDFPATVSVTRASGPIIGDETTATADLLSEIDATIADLDARTPPAGVDPVLYEQERDIIRVLRDSLEVQLGRLNPTGRALALSFIAQIREQTDVSLMAAEAACDSQQARVNCVKASKVSLSRDLFRIVKIIAVLGGGSLLGIAAFGVTITGGIAFAVMAAATAVALTTLSIESRTALAKIVTTQYERALEPVVRIEAALDELTNSRALVSESGVTSSAVSLPTFQPGVPVRLPIARVTRSAVLGDTFPLVRGLADTVNLLAARLDEVSDLLPEGLRIPRRTVGVTPARMITERADFAEVSIVSIREGGQPVVGVTGSLTDAAPGINLTLNGDPGAGRDLTLRLALDGDGAGRVEFETAIRYEALPDTLDWAAAVLSGPWNGRTLAPTAANYCEGSDGYAFPPNFSNNEVVGAPGDPNRYVRATWTWSCVASSWRTRTWRYELKWNATDGWTGLRRTDAGGVENFEVYEFTSSTLRTGVYYGETFYSDVLTRGGQ